MAVAKDLRAGQNRVVKIPAEAGNARATGDRPGPFHASALVLVTLSAPREKFWGVLLEVAEHGLSVRGVELSSFEDFVSLVKEGEPAAASAVFFPMHRVERMEMDARNGEIPSLAERFQAKTGLPAWKVLGETAPGIAVGCTLAEARQRLVAATLEATGGDRLRAAAILGIAEEELEGA